MTSSCQTAFTPSTRIPLFTFQHPFSLSLQSGERHRSRVIFPDCQISNFHFFFPSGLETVHDTLKQHFFFFLPLFAILLVTNLVTLINCQHLSIFCFDYCQNFFFRIFNSFSQTFQFLHFLAIIFGYSTFWLTPHVPPSTNIVIAVLAVWLSTLYHHHHLLIPSNDGILEGVFAHHISFIIPRTLLLNFPGG